MLRVGLGELGERRVVWLGLGPGVVVVAGVVVIVVVVSGNVAVALEEFAVGAGV